MTWDKQVPGVVSPNLYFASHPADEKRAFEWLVDLRKRGIGWKAAREQLEEYLKSAKASAAHIQMELKSLERYLKPWLID